jgi:hypothetical protein
LEDIMTPSRRGAEEIFLTQAGRQLLLDRARELRDGAGALIGSLENQAGEPWTVDERERGLDELERLTSALVTARAVEELPGAPRVVLLGNVVDLHLSDGTAEEVRAPSESYRCTIVSAERETTG